MPLPIKFTPQQIYHSRLKKVFKNNLNYSLDFYEKLENAKNTVVGNIPDDILHSILNNSPETKREEIQKVKDIFAKSSLFFRRDGIKHEKEINKMIENNDTEGLLDKVFFFNFMLDRQNSEKQIAFCKRAGSIMKRILKKVFPQDSKINIEWIKQGSYNDVFKLEFLDSNDKKLFSDKVFKIHKYMPELCSKIYRHLLKNDAAEVKKYFYETAPDQKSAAFYSQIMIDDFLKEAEFFLSQESANAMGAEANGYYYMSKNNGHCLKNSDFLKIDMYDIKNKYSLSSFRSDDAQPPNRRVNLKKIGVVHNDLKPRNVINGTCIDMGGFIKVDEVLTDSVVRKIFSRIINEKDIQKRQNLLHHLILDCENPKVPDRRKIKDALALYFKYLQA